MIANWFVLQLAYTSAPGEGVIANFKDYDRKFSPHFVRMLLKKISNSYDF